MDPVPKGAESWQTALEHPGSGCAVPKRLAWGMDSLILSSASPAPPPPSTDTAWSPGCWGGSGSVPDLAPKSGGMPGSQWGSCPHFLLSHHQEEAEHPSRGRSLTPSNASG